MIPSLSDYLSGAALLLVIVGIIATYQNSKRSVKSQGLEDATKTIELLKQRIDEQDRRISDLRNDLLKEHEIRIRLEEQIRLKDTAIKEYLDILQNRDPALTEFIKATTKSMDVVVRGIEELLKTHRIVTKKSK